MVTKQINQLYPAIFVQIVRSAKVKPEDVVCEVGPGPGGITRAILEAGCSRLDVIEIDHRFLQPLQVLFLFSNNSSCF